MPIVHFDRIRETTSTTGTGTMTLSGATAAFRALSTITASGSGTLQFYYTVFDNSNFECGIGTYVSATTFNRTTVISSSNSNNAVNWSSGTKAVILSDNSDFFETYRSCADVTLTAGENLYQNDTVVVDYDNGKAYRLNPETVARGTGGWFSGFVVADAAVDTLVQVRNVGYVDTLSGMNTGKKQFAATTRYGRCNRGFIVGGRTGAVDFNTVDIITFSTDITTANTTDTLNGSFSRQSAISEQINKCYFAGGVTGGANSTNVEIIFFSTDIINSQTTAVLATARSSATGLTEGNTKGYVTGGDTGANALTTEKITFSSDLFSSQTTANISQARIYLASVSDGGTKGFVVGGFTTASVATADKITFTTDVNNSRTSSNLSQARYGLAGSSEGRTKGYFAGGFSTANVATADLLSYFTESTAASTASNLSQARLYATGTSQGSTHGYFAGGQTGVSIAVNTAEKILFSSNTTAANTSSNLSSARFNATAGGCDAGRSLSTTEDPENIALQLGIAISSTTMIIDSQGSKVQPPYISGEKGYFLGGFTGAAVTTGNKLTFSNDTTAAQTTANLSAAASSTAGISEGTYAGYVTGGATTGSILNKVTFSTDTATSISSVTKTVIDRIDMGGLSNLLNKGYFLGGRSAASTLVATANKFIYASETNVLVSTANLSTVRDRMATVCDGLMKGYICGGSSTTTPTRVTTTDRLTFSYDITNAVTTANLSQARDYTTGLSFPARSNGYVMGGSTSAAVVTSDKLTFSTDSNAALTTANLSQARSGAGSFSELYSKGYVAGGITTAAVATADRILFSTEVTAAQASANLTQARYYMAAFSDVGV